MQYARVGSSGLVVSRLVLGMMSFGDHSQRAWHLDLDAARPLVRRAAEAGITAYDTADYYDRGVSEEVTRSAAARALPATRGLRGVHEGVLPDVRRAR